MLTYLYEPFIRSFDYRGRARRTEFFAFLLFQLALLVCSGAAVVSFPGVTDPAEAFAVVITVHMVVFALPVVALQVRRMHDQDKSGWWILVGLVPYLGTGMLAYFMFSRGSWGANRFGPDPRHDWDGDLFE